MIVPFAGVAFDVIALGTAFSDVELFAGHDQIGGIGAAGPFLATGEGDANQYVRRCVQ